MAETISNIENTELIKVSEDKHKYINTDFKRISQKIYDYSCDIKLIIQKETFRAHKDVLANASDYFDAMFSHNMKEKSQDAIEFMDISSKGFSLMLEYFYHGNITIEPCNIDAILENSRFFHIIWIVSVCCDFLVRHLSLENYESVLHLADKFSLGDLRYDIYRFFGQNFTKLAEKSKFMCLSYELFSTLLEENYFIHASEFSIFQAALRWLQYDDHRMQYKIPLLKLIRYSHFDEAQLFTLPEYVVEEPELCELIKESKNYHANPSKQCILASERTEARGSINVVMLISAFEDANLIQYKVDNNPGYFESPIDTTFLDSVFEFTCLTQLGNFVFVVGGYNRLSWCSTNLVYRFNPRDQSWAEITSMCSPRVSFALCSSTHGLYAVAGINHIVENGIDRDVFLDSVEYYDPVSGIWRYVISLPLTLCSTAAATNQEVLFVSGGISDVAEENVPVSHLLSYVPGDTSWTFKSPMLESRQGHAMVSCNDRLYVFGGFTSGSNSMSFKDCMTNEMYNIETDQWTQLIDSAPYLKHINSSACVQDNCIYLLGGTNEEKHLLTFCTEALIFTEEEICEDIAQKLVSVRIGFPFDT